MPSLTSLLPGHRVPGSAPTPPTNPPSDPFSIWHVRHPVDRQRLTAWRPRLIPQLPRGAHKVKGDRREVSVGTSVTDAPGRVSNATWWPSTHQGQGRLFWTSRFSREGAGPVAVLSHRAQVGSRGGAGAASRTSRSWPALQWLELCLQRRVFSILRTEPFPTWPQMQPEKTVMCFALAQVSSPVGTAPGAAPGSQGIGSKRNVWGPATKSSGGLGPTLATGPQARLLLNRYSCICAPNTMKRLLSLHGARPRGNG